MTREARRQPHQQLGDFIEHMGGGPGCTLSVDGVSTRPLDALADDIAVALAPAMRNLCAVGAETIKRLSSWRDDWRGEGRARRGDRRGHGQGKRPRARAARAARAQQGRAW